ncbi:CCR4-Not complex component, Not1-domain-containing protein [Mycotypha africana]|uniref:CCR4-Not complex component, Not1-domain-containing protein n=1 Tax=Mycotypha africana TaxID=64632 RepID=UPI0022FFE885|nr:CCR4-Not complex component, Not1-domain-containing protein [Mycotypha africana]KAI8970255.1 CCR4-Not complex component, Not1-domain-containing protein [Mycotypha africana]
MANEQNEQFKQVILDMYSNNPSSVTRILELSKDVNAIPSILDSLPPALALDLACLADIDKSMNLETWLEERLNNPELRETFANQCLDYLVQKISLEVQRQDPSKVNLPIALSVDSVRSFLKALTNSSLTPQLTEKLKDIQNRCLQLYPQLHTNAMQAVSATGPAIATGMPPAQVVGPGGGASFKPDIEEEANMYYERIYNGELSVDDMIELLKRLSISKAPRDQDVFACMIHNLFDEYAFFPKYPEKELSITATLFGLLIQHRLVSYVPLGVALRYILEALRNPAGSKMFNFGVQALRQFQGRLTEWPQYCAHLLETPALVEMHPDIVTYIQTSLSHPNAQIKPGEDLDPNNHQHFQPTLTIPFTSIHPPQIPEVADLVYQEPSSTVQDTILFTINNVAQNNIESKVSNLREVLIPSAYKWFSNYLVTKRISAEPNYHELYIMVLDYIGSKLLNNHILAVTYANALLLLNSEKTVTNSSERSLLKNLGSWLGRMTLAKNKPILHKNLMFKNLLLEGYDTQRLIVVIPFVCKVLEQCADSKVFKPPNPWLMAILKLLVELYEFAELKLNLKFEIEVLCKSLSVELKDITPTTVLKDRQPQAQNNSKNAFASSGSGYPGRAAAGGNPLLQNADTEPSTINDIPINIPNLAPYIAFNPQIALFNNHPAAKRLVLQAFTDSVREIIGPVVERAVAIAVVSTRDLVLKDFVMENNENKMRDAAHLMAQNLSASLAMVTSREPLRLSIVSNLKAIFLAHGLSDTMAENAIFNTVENNLELMCAVIEKAAMERATLEIDDILATAYAARKKHREQKTSQPFVDMETFQMSAYINTLPPVLRPKPGGLQPAQLSIYEDFMRIPRVPPAAAAPAAPMAASMDPAAFAYNGSGYGNNLSTPISNGLENVPTAIVQQQQQHIPQASVRAILERFAQCIAEIENLISQTNISTISALPHHSDIRTLIRQIPMLAYTSFDKSETARAFAQKIVQLLYKSERQLAIEVYVVILEHLYEVAPAVGNLVTTWLTHADDERKYNVPVTVALIKAGLISLPEQDQELAVLINSGRKNAIEFSVRLIRACLLGEYPLATSQEFMASLEALSNLRGNQIPENVISLLEELRRVPTPQHLQAQDMAPPSSTDGNLYEQLQYFFAEWVRVYQHPAATEKTLLTFVTQLSQQDILRMNDVATLFYRVCIEASVEHAIKFKMLAGQSPALGYQPIDALSKLIVCLTQVTMADEADPLIHVRRALSVAVLCISQHHEIRGQHFDQRPFLRLFTSLLTDFHKIEQQMLSLYLPLLNAFSSTFLTLQPLKFPGFSLAWLQLISHRFFMPQLLLAENQQGWPTFQRLLICLFEFLAPYLRKLELRDTTRTLYRGTLRVLLVLLHDFPEFLSDYHYSFCDVIPAISIQMRNLILSAFPRHMRLPDPFTPNLKIDLLTETHQSPRVLSDVTSIIEENNLKQELDQILEKSKIPSTDFLKVLLDKMYDSTKKTFNTRLVNAVTFYIGMVTISRGTPVHQGPALEIYQYLLSELTSEGRYLLLSAIANQLRYPNSHTHYFSCLLLYLFVEGKNEVAKEQITRVLLERLIVNRPHPWGLLITFIELIKNPRYSFWSHSFTRCATDIERLFESVSR